MTSSPGRTPLEASRRRPPDDPRLGPADPDEQATVSIYLRPAPSSPLAAGVDPVTVRTTREGWRAVGGADDADIALVRSFAGDHHLEVVEVDADRRVVRVSGRVGDLAEAFEAELHVHQGNDDSTYRAQAGALSIPTDVAEGVTGVFGLDERPQAGTQFRVGSAQAVSYTPVEVAAAYRFPAGTGAGACVGLVELGGGYRSADLDTYFSSLGLSTPTVTAVPVDGGANAPTTATSSDAEVMLDIEIVGAVANGASIAVYFAPNTDQGFLDAVTTAVHDTTNRPSVVSISWGGPESTWTSQAMQQLESALAAATALGVTVVTAAGDSGSTDGVTDGESHVDFPSSAPHALACGGTSLQLGNAGGADPTVTSEVVWNDLSENEGATGGGVSVVFAVPSYQTGAGVPVSANPGGTAGRGVPDVAGNADPETGYNIRVDGTDMVVAGTSAVAPLWAGLLALLNEALGRDVGYVNPQLYALASGGGAFYDIVSGNNGAYQAQAGWDACSGQGSPRGDALLTGLRAAIS